MSIRYRRNIECLTDDQLHDLREAYQALYDLPEASTDSFATLGGIHGSPAPSWCDHGTPGFLTWHRAYLRAFERALQSVRCDVMLPFWDWSSGPTTGVPEPCRHPTYVDRHGDIVPNPLYSGPIASAAGGGTTTRRPDIDTTTYADIATLAQSAMANATFADFQDDLNGPHGSVHVRTGGQMSSVPLAGFDPIFFLHHCNVDRLWWNWQQVHPGAAVPASELAHELDPFNRPFTTDWQTGSDVISTDDLGYRYQNWCFFIPPILVWQLVPIRLDPIVLRRFRNARLVVRAARMPTQSIELQVFVGEERAVRDHATERNPSYVGAVGLFGMGDHPMGHPTRSNARFDVGVNLTDHLRERCGLSSGDEPGDEPGHGGHEGHGPDHAADHPAEHAGAHHDDRGGASLFLRVAAFGQDGRALDPKQVPIDGLELVID